MRYSPGAGSGSTPADSLSLTCGAGPTMNAACLVCSSKDIVFAFVNRGYRLHRCRHCHHLAVMDSVSTMALAAFYDKDYYEGAALPQAERNGYDDYLGTIDKRTAHFKKRLKEVERFSNGPGRILDYGCAIGLFVKVARDAGWTAKGIERSAWAVAYGRKAWGLDIVNSDGTDDPFVGESFDVVTLWDVIEHVQSPATLMKQVRRWLRPDGLLLLNTVNSSSLGAKLAGQQWRHMYPPGHLQYFSRRSLTYLLQDNGFRIVHVTGNGVALRGQSATAPLHGLARLLERVMCARRLRPIATLLNLLDEIELVAVRQ
jgi:2-polyprenyl-3-methyl-5-hydroxy-6-metoxy-1,4-benzoquinol methylase